MNIIILFSSVGKIDTRNVALKWNKKTKRRSKLLDARLLISVTAETKKLNSRQYCEFYDYLLKIE